MGALNFYADRVAAFDDEAVEIGLIYATHAALVWQLVRRDESFAARWPAGTSSARPRAC